jgi:hypothetical protein
MHSGLEFFKISTRANVMSSDAPNPRIEPKIPSEIFGIVEVRSFGPISNDDGVTEHVCVPKPEMGSQKLGQSCTCRLFDMAEGNDGFHRSHVQQVVPYVTDEGIRAP